MPFLTSPILGSASKRADQRQLFSLAHCWGHRLVTTSWVHHLSCHKLSYKITAVWHIICQAKQACTQPAFFTPDLPRPVPEHHSLSTPAASEPCMTHSLLHKPGSTVELHQKLKCVQVPKACILFGSWLKKNLEFLEKVNIYSLIA